MEKILKELSGKQYGNKYCFSRNNKKFIAVLDYDGVVDYGWRNLIRINSVDNEYSNVFRFKKGGFRNGEVKYWDDKSNKIIIVTDFSDIVEEITEWIDFMVL